MKKSDRLRITAKAGGATEDCKDSKDMAGI